MPRSPNVLFPLFDINKVFGYTDHPVQGSGNVVGHPFVPCQIGRALSGHVSRDGGNWLTRAFR